MLSLRHLEGGTYTLMETELQGQSLPHGLPGSRNFLSTNGSHSILRISLQPANQVAIIDFPEEKGNAMVDNLLDFCRAFTEQETRI
jgi:hypothetical protein